MKTINNMTDIYCLSLICHQEERHPPRGDFPRVESVDGQLWLPKDQGEH